MVPPWIFKYLKASDLEKIKEAVTRAEKRTSGELVPIVVRSSSTIGHVPFMVLFLLTSLFFILDLDHLQQEWIEGPIWILYSVDVVLFIGLTFLASPLPLVQRMLIPKKDRAQQVEQRALVEFYGHEIHKTRDSTGILIFISLMEHQAVVLGDQSISSRLKPDAWEGVILRLVQAIKKKDLASGLIEGIEASGELLAEQFPIKDDDTNELKNHLIIKD